MKLVHQEAAPPSNTHTSSSCTARKIRFARNKIVTGLTDCDIRRNLLDACSPIFKHRESCSPTQSDFEIQEYNQKAPIRALFVPDLIDRASWHEFYVW
jgi:hypothetical protein